MAGFNNYYNGYNGYNGYMPPTNTWGNTTTGYPQQQPQQTDYREFVHGRAGADAYQLKPGVNMQILWDDEVDRFYVKGYDNSGRPRVLADNDFFPHVEPEPQAANIDLSNYATKDDIRQMITEAFQQQIPQMKAPDMSNYVTVQQFNQELGNLSVGNGGRIVRNNESNA